MQIHEITLRRRKVDEALGGLGSFMSGLTGGMSDKYMDKTPGGVKSGFASSGVNPADYGPGAAKPSTKWQDKYAALQKDPAVSSYVKNIATSWAKNPQAAGEPTQGLATGATLQKTVPSLVTAAKQTNNNLTSTQIGQILAQKAPTIWNNTQDKAAAIKQLSIELTKQGVTVDGKQAATAPVAKTAQVAKTAPVAKTNTGGRVAGQLSQTPGAVAKRDARAQATQANTAGAGAFNQMANQLGGKAPNTMANAPISKVNIAKPTNPNQPQQSMADYIKQNPTAKYHDVTGEITPHGQQQADIKAQADKNLQAKNVAKYKQQAADVAAAETPPATTPATTIPASTSTTSFDPTDKKAVADFKNQLKGQLKGKRSRVPSTPGGEPAKPGQMPASVAKSAQGKRMRKVYGKPRGGIQGMTSDLEEAVTMGPAADQYRAAFIKWADGQFATRVQETGTTVTMDAVRKAFPDLADKLKSASDKVIATKGTAQQVPAVEEYAKLAVAGVQALAQMQKNKVSTVDQQKNKQISNTTGSVKQSLSQAGVDPTRLSQIGNNQSARSTGNPSADSLLKLSGFKV